VRTHKCRLQTIPRINQLKVTETTSSQDKRFEAEMQLTVFVRRLEDSITSSLEKKDRTHSVVKAESQLGQEQWKQRFCTSTSTGKVDFPCMLQILCPRKELRKWRKKAGGPEAH